MKKLGFIILFLLIAIPVMINAETKTTNYRNALVFAYSPANNVYEDENIKLEIYDECLWAINKTEKTIFLDLSQCFGVHNGSSYPLFGKQTDETDASKKQYSTSIDEFISIAPYTGNIQNETFIVYLGSKMYGEYTTAESPSGDFSEYDERLLTLINEMVSESLEGDSKGKEYIGTSYRHLTEDESINNIGVNVAYAFNKKSEEWTPVAMSTWVSDIYFAPYYIEMPKEPKRKDKRGFGVKKVDAVKTHIKADFPFEFEQDKSPILVMDWAGNYKKGTFKLGSTRISKKGNLKTTLFSNPYETYYKQEILFDGNNDDWGKLRYMKLMDLSKFSSYGTSVLGYGKWNE